MHFDSVFESGNLAIALKVSETEYNLLLQNDINTNGHTQWYFFKVKAKFDKPTKVKFNIVNLYKPKSLYQQGLKVLSLDVGTQASKDGLPKWVRGCEDIKYGQNQFFSDLNLSGLHSLEFTYEFPGDYSEVYFAHSIPYTYSMLNDFLNKYATKDRAKRATYCHSLAGNRVEYLVVTNKRTGTSRQNSASSLRKPVISKLSAAEAVKEQAADNESRKQTEKKTRKTSMSPCKSPKKKNKEKTFEDGDIKRPEKQIIVLTSRVHPGESNASWMIHGLM